MTSDKTTFELADLERLLDTWGSDRSRWPAAAHARADVLLARHADADRMLREASALDSLLRLAPLPAAAQYARAADRIVAAGGEAAAPLAERRGGTVLPWPVQPRRRGLAALAELVRSSWPAPALLAASLAIGVFIGALDLAPAPVNNLVETVESGGDVDQAVATVDGDGLIAVLDEDFL